MSAFQPVLYRIVWCLEQGPQEWPSLQIHPASVAVTGVQAPGQPSSPALQTLQIGAVLTCLGVVLPELRCLQAALALAAVVGAQALGQPNSPALQSL